MQSVAITTKVVSSSTVHDEAYSMQNYEIKVVSDLRQVGGFLRVHPVSSTNKSDHHDITEILLKVALNTISLNHISNNFPIAMTIITLHQIIMCVASDQSN